MGNHHRAQRFRYEELIDRVATGEWIADGYRAVPQTEAEIAWADEAAVRMIAAEPW